MGSRLELPIFEIQDQLLNALQSCNRLILQAPTGSGKSTQVPQMLLNSGMLGAGEVVVLQPRRLAARMLAARVAQERSINLGEEVGYQIRFEEKISSKTRIRFVTEGILLRQIISDPELKGVSAILFDEFHERHLYSDVTLVLALQTQQNQRPDLKLIAMSATLASDALQKYLAPTRLIQSEGRTFPIEIEYLRKNPDFEQEPVWEMAARELERVIQQQSSGDVLIFMPGVYEIFRTVQAVQARFKRDEIIVLPLHGELTNQDQDAAVARYEKRKVVVATNVAETSLTIDGITIVIDSGLARVAKFDPYRGINTLLIEKISCASADQRSGRAGRTAPGFCLRLWTERDHQKRLAQEIPEIRRVDLAEMVLLLKAAGILDLHHFPWFEAPVERALHRAENLLKDLGAIEPLEKTLKATETSTISRLTPLGRRMVSFPAHPRYARMLLAAGDWNCVRPVALIAALTQSRNILVRKVNREVQERREILGEEGTVSDFFPLMRAWSYAHRSNYEMGRCQALGIHAQGCRQVTRLFEQFLRIAEAERLDVSEKPVSDETIQRCLLIGFVDHFARREDEGTLRCVLVHGRRGSIARESAIQKSRLLVAAEVREIESSAGDLNVLLQLNTAVEENWLREMFPEDFQEIEKTFFDSTQRRVMARKEIWFRDLLLCSESLPDPSLEQAAQLLAAEVMAGRCPLTEWNDEVEQWFIRIHCLKQWCPELPWSFDLKRQSLIEQVCYGALSYKEIKNKSVWPIVRVQLNSQQHHYLETYTPTHLLLPGGRKAKIVYSMDSAPIITARIQDLYGIEGALKIANNRIQLTIQVLTPNQRPIQTTQDLTIFWKETYPRIKQELQRKYPKHEWR